MRFKSQREEEPRVSIAPLIDIVFLLLIFFMVTYHFDIASGVKIDLPDITKKMQDDDQGENITLIIDKSGRIILDGNEIDLETLRNRFLTRIKKEGSINLILQADKDVSHGRVVEIMDLAKNAGIRSIIIAARWKAGKPL